VRHLLFRFFTSYKKGNCDIVVSKLKRIDYIFYLNQTSNVGFIKLRKTNLIMRYLTALMAGFLVFSCGIKQPVENNAMQQSGNIYVNSQPDSAFIFLDGQNTFHLTPDTLKNVPVGRHIISVKKSGYRVLTDSVVINLKADSVANVTFTLKKLVFLGTLALASDPAGAEIFIDGQSTGRFTPDTLQLSPGTHTVELQKNGFKPVVYSVTIANDSTDKITSHLEIQQCVVFESFGNVSCEPCVTSAENLEKFRREHSEPNYLLFEYYANWPSPNDPFYKVSPKDVDERVQYYRIYTLPKLRLNGETGVDASDYNAISDAYANAVANQNTRLAVSVSKRLLADSLKVFVEIYDYAHILQNDQLRLFVLVYEDNIHYENPPGTNGLKDFNFVFRKFLSDRKGDVIQKSTTTYTLQWPGWVFANTHVAAFIQDISSKKIYQATVN